MTCVHPVNFGTHTEWVWQIQHGMIFYAGSCKSKEESERSINNKIKEIKK